MTNDQTQSGTNPPVEMPDESELARVIDENDAELCLAWVQAADAETTIHAFAALDEEQRAQALTILPTEEAAALLEIIPEYQAAEAIADIDANIAADILEALPSDERADFLAAVSEDEAFAIINALEDNIADDVRRLVAYDEDCAGGLMITEFLAFHEDATVREVLDSLELNAEVYAKYNIQYSYVVDQDHRLVGVLPIRGLLLSKRARPISEITIRNPIRALDTDTVEDLEENFDAHHYFAVPVVSPEGVLLGVVERSAIEHALAEEAEDLYRASQGIVGGDELRSMPLTLRARRRLAWLSANIVLNILAASIIAFHQDTLEAVIALAVFLPIISDMSGCSGNQAVAVSMRELTLGVTRPNDAIRVLLKEASVGIVNGIVLGLLIGTVAYLWKGNIYLSGVVAIALAMNTIIAVCIGGTVPLVLKAFKADPALASGPILTTITDMCGFLIVLTMASAMMTGLTA